MFNLLIGGGFDTTTALTAHALEWLSEHPDERSRLSPDRDTLVHPATEEFLRFFTPAPGMRAPSPRTSIRRHTQRGRAAVAVLGHGQPRPCTFQRPR